MEDKAQPSGDVHPITPGDRKADNSMKINKRPTLGDERFLSFDSVEKQESSCHCEEQPCSVGLPAPPEAGHSGI